MIRLFPRILVSALAGSILTGGLIILVADAEIKNISASLGSTDNAAQALRDWHPHARSRILTADGKTAGYIGQTPYPYTPLENISAYLPEAVIAAEDQSFETNPGIDIRGIARAFVSNVSGSGREGASTITQQLAKITLLDNNSRTAERKIKQMILATRLARAIPKERVLDLYLNLIWLGHNSNGITEAASAYFNKKPRDLSLAESALLAGMIRNPTELDPSRHEAAARRRRNHVLHQMARMKVIPESDATAAMAEPIILTPGTSRPRSEDTTPSLYGWATDIVRSRHNMTTSGTHDLSTTILSDFQAIMTRDMAEGLSEDEMTLHGNSLAIDHLSTGSPPPAFPSDIEITENTPEWTHPWIVTSVSPLKISDGQNIITPDMDARTQLASRRLHPGDIVMAGSPDPSMNPVMIKPTKLNGAAILVDSRTGNILAMTGGLRWTPTGFNRTTQSSRPPGSSLKPLLYLAAIEQGWKPEDTVFDTPITLPGSSPDTPWEPQDDDGSSDGPMTMAQALRESRNLPVVNLGYTMGLREIGNAVVRLGLYPSLPNFSALLGSEPVTPLSMASAYTAIANHGTRSLPRLEADEPIQSQQSTDPQASDTVMDMMGQVLAPGGTASNMAAIARKISARGYQTGAKTGTTSNFKDAWFVSIAKPYVLIIRIGYDQQKTMSNEAFASDITAPTAMKILNEITEKKENK